MHDSITTKRILLTILACAGLLGCGSGFDDDAEPASSEQTSQPTIQATSAPLPGGGPFDPDPAVCCNVPGATEPMIMSASDCWAYPGALTLPIEECSCVATVGLCPGLSYPNCPYPGAPGAINGDVDCDGVIDSRFFCPSGTVPADLDGDGCEEICVCEPCEDLWGLCPDLVYLNCPYVGAPGAIWGDYGCDGTLDVRYVCPPGTAPADLNGDGCDEVCLCEGSSGGNGGNGGGQLVCCDFKDGGSPVFVSPTLCTSSGGDVLANEQCEP